MNWRSARTIDIYDQSSQGEAVFSTLAEYQEDLSRRHYAIQPTHMMNPLEQSASSGIPQPVLSPDQSAAIVWMHDAETLDWIKSMEQQTGQPL